MHSKKAAIIAAGGAVTAIALASFCEVEAKSSNQIDPQTPQKAAHKLLYTTGTTYARHLPLSWASSRFTPDIRKDIKQELNVKSLGSKIDPMLHVILPTAALFLMSTILMPATKTTNNLMRTTARKSPAAPFLLALAAAAAANVPSHVAQAEATVAAQKQFCPTYGCPITPQDMLYAPVQQALKKIRNKSKAKLKAHQTTKEVLLELKSSGDETKATLTLTGFKGGDLEDQINQDRAFVISPYMTEGHAAAESEDDLEKHRLQGIFDGHATDGEKVSEYCLRELPKMLACRLSERLTKDLTDAQQQTIVVATLHEIFLELDRTAPHGESGGCTASVMFQMGKKLYIANTGDSPTFLCVHHSTSKATEVVYMTREDKPSLPDERARVERMGGKVWVPNGGGSCRVLFTDPGTGDQTGIAMSRSIGDRDVGKYGVIPDPIIDVIDLEELIQERMAKMKASRGILSRLAYGQGDDDAVDDVHIFAVSASDGMMDILNPKGIARFLVPSLCQDSGEHLLTACEKLISTAADGWTRASHDGQYRDDIAISVSKIRTPPPPPTKC